MSFIQLFSKWSSLFNIWLVIIVLFLFLQKRCPVWIFAYSWKYIKILLKIQILNCFNWVIFGLLYHNYMRSWKSFRFIFSLKHYFYYFQKLNKTASCELFPSVPEIIQAERYKRSTFKFRCWIPLYSPHIEVIISDESETPYLSVVSLYNKLLNFGSNFLPVGIN